MTSGVVEFDEMGRSLFRPHVPAFPPMDRVHDLLDPTLVALREFDRRMTALDGRGAIGRLFARLDAVHSSGAEGSTTTFTDLMEYESALRAAPDADDAATVAAAAAGFDEHLEHGDLERLVLRLHRRLFAGSRDRMIASEAGKLKRSPNFVRDADAPAGLFGYTNPDSVKEVVKEWQAFTLETNSVTHELIRQILSHWMFEHIHPVPDGNGRIGRLLLPIVSKAKGLTTTACAFFGEAVHEDKALYIDALKDARMSGQTVGFVRQMLSFLRRTATANLERLDRLEQIEADWNRRFVHVRRSSVVHRLTAYAVTKPVFTVRDVEKDLSVSFAAANAAVRALSDEGIVSVPDNARRDRLFHADDVLGVFDRFRTPSPGRSLP